MKRFTPSGWMGLVALLLMGWVLCPPGHADQTPSPAPSPAPQEVQPLPLTAEERQWLAAHPRLRLGDDFAWPPFVFLDAHGVYSGISAGYVTAIGKLLGIRIEPVMGLTWEQVMARIKGGGIDLLPAVARSEERERFLNFTQPYITFPVVIATHEEGLFVSDLKDLTGHRVGVVKGYITHELLARDHPGINLATFTDLAAALAALEARQIDALVDNLGAITYETRRLRLAHVRIAAPTGYQFELAMGVRKDWPELAAILDKAIKAMSTRERAAIENTWLAVQVQFGVSPQTLLLWGMPIGLSVALVLIVILVWNRKLKREASQRQKAQRALQAASRELASINRQLLEKNAFIDNLLRYSTDIAIAATDLEFRIRYFNASAEALFGHPQEEVIGRTVFEMHELAKLDPARFEKARATIKARGEHTFEAVLKVSGEPRTITARMSGILDSTGHTIGYVLMARDVTEARRAEHYRMKNETRLRMLLELNQAASALNEQELCSRVLDIAVTITDSVIGYLHMVNEDQQTIRLGVWNAATLAHCNVVHATHYPVARAGIWADAFRLKQPVVHNDYPHAPGRKGMPEGHFPLQRHLGAPVMDGGVVHMVIGVGNKAAPYTDNDVEQLQLVADELQKFLLRRRAEESLKEARATAEAANRAKSEFLAIMSHEIRTPLNVLLGMSDMLQESQLSGEQREQLEMVQQAGNHLLGVINDILDLSKIEVGGMALEAAPFQPGRLLQLVGAMMGSRAKEKGLAFHLKLAPDLPPWALGDENRLRQVLMNLLGNAVKFTEQGSITLRMTHARQNGAFHITISDTGVGIAPQHLEQIFDKFTQADASISRRYGGTGLGLAIARNLVLLMGGSIHVESRLGKGSTFHIALPLPRAEAPVQPEGEPPSQQAGPPALAPLTILLAEDSQDNQSLIRAYLKRTPWQLVTAMDGQEAVARIQADTDTIDLVLMDIQMPVMDGYAATRAIRAWEQREGRTPLPILALSAHALVAEKRKSLAAGCNAHLVKPIKKADLISAIQGYAPSPSGR